jgi:hypothetical protein
MASLEKKKTINKSPKLNDNRVDAQIFGKPSASGATGTTIHITLKKYPTNNSKKKNTRSLSGKKYYLRSINKSDAKASANSHKEYKVLYFSNVESINDNTDPVFVAMEESKRLLKSSPVINFDKVRFE